MTISGSFIRKASPGIALECPYTTSIVSSAPRTFTKRFARSYEGTEASIAKTEDAPENAALKDSKHIGPVPISKTRRPETNGFPGFDGDSLHEIAYKGTDRQEDAKEEWCKLIEYLQKVSI